MLRNPAHENASQTVALHFRSERVLRGLIYFPAVFELSVFKISLRQPHHKVGRVLDDAWRRRHLLSAACTCSRNRIHILIIGKSEFGSHGRDDRALNLPCNHPPAVFLTFIVLPSKLTS
jgi:hypothetical protein